MSGYPVIYRETGRFTVRRGNELPAVVDAYCSILSWAEFAEHPNALIMAEDTEWDTGPRRHTYLSHQFCVMTRTRCASSILESEAGRRLTLGEIVENGLRSTGTFPENDSGPIKVCLVRHFGLAELSMQADRSSPEIRKRLTTVHKVPVTLGNRRIPVALPSGSLAHVRLFDTWNLAPAGFASLGKLSALLGKSEAEKVPLSSREKRSMRSLYIKDPTRFRDYAIRDPEATVQVFLALQQALNRIVFGDDVSAYRLFTTLGNAALNDLQRYLDEREQTILPKNRTPGAAFYHRVKGLWISGYSGGRNEGAVRLIPPRTEG